MGILPEDKIDFPISYERFAFEPRITQEPFITLPEDKRISKDTVQSALELDSIGSKYVESGTHNSTIEEDIETALTKRYLVKGFHFCAAFRTGTVGRFEAQLRIERSNTVVFQAEILLTSSSDRDNIFSAIDIILEPGDRIFYRINRNITSATYVVTAQFHCEVIPTA